VPGNGKDAVRGEPGLAFFTVVAIGQILPRGGKGNGIDFLGNQFLWETRK
jgi:hypothetical protein